jgi:molecular chaperone DnaJ
MLGQMVTASVCPKCGGLGEVVVTPCPTCNGDGRILVDKTYQVDVPAGVDTGSTLRLTGRGAIGPRNGGAGDLYVHIRVAQSELFQRDGDDLVHVFPVSIAQAALGTRRPLATPDGEIDVVVQPGTQPGREIVFRNKGVPRLRGRGRGDLRVLVNVEVPTRLNNLETELLRKLAEERGEEVGIAEPGLFSRIKSAFQ